MDSVRGEGPGVLRIDLDTQEYEVLLTRDSQPSDQPDFSSPNSFRLHPSNPERAIGMDSDRMLSLDLTTGVRTLISDNEGDFSGPSLWQPNDLLVDAANNRALVTDIGHSNLYWVDLETGDRELLLAEGVPEGTPEPNILSIVTDDIEQRVFGVDWISNALWSVDTGTGEHEVVSGPGVPHGYNEVTAFRGIALSESNEYLIGVESVMNGVFVIDLKTGERVILSNY